MPRHHSSTEVKKVGEKEIFLIVKSFPDKDEFLGSIRIESEQ